MMADSTNGLLPCPFCRHHACEPIQVQGERWGSYDWVIHCSSSHCGAQARIVADGWSEQIDGTLNRHIPPDQLYTDRLVQVRRMWNRRAHLASAPDTEWQSIDTAPKTGEHILVAVFDDGSAGFGICGGKQQHWMDVVHWFDNGFYSSEYGMNQSLPFKHLTHWKPL